MEKLTFLTFFYNKSNIITKLKISNWKIDVNYCRFVLMLRLLFDFNLTAIKISSNLQFFQCKSIKEKKKLKIVKKNQKII